MAYDFPSVADFRAYFVRDFPYGVDINTSVTDTDIAKAYQLVNFNINEANYSTQATFTVGYLLLAAHNLVMSLRASSQGMSGQFAWAETGKSVGNVSQSFQIPDRILENPEFAMLAKTNYGAQWLSLILPQLTGQVFIAFGSTRPI